MAKANKAIKAAEVEASVGITPADTAVETIVDQHIEQISKEPLVVDGKVMALNVAGLLNSNAKDPKFQEHIGREIDVIVLDEVKPLEGDVITFQKDDKKFVKSFDKKEENVWIVSFGRKASQGGKIKLKAAFDASTGILKLDGEGFESAELRVYFK